MDDHGEQEPAYARPGSACWALPGVMAALALTIAVFAAQFEEAEADVAQQVPLASAQSR